MMQSCCYVCASWVVVFCDAFVDRVRRVRDFFGVAEVGAVVSRGTRSGSASFAAGCSAVMATKSRALKASLKFGPESRVYKVLWFVPVPDLLTDLQQLVFFVLERWVLSFSFSAVIFYLSWRFGMLYAACRPGPSFDRLVVLYVPGLVIPFWHGVVARDDQDWVEEFLEDEDVEEAVPDIFSVVDNGATEFARTTKLSRYLLILQVELALLVSCPLYPFLLARSLVHKNRVQIVDLSGFPQLLVQACTFYAKSGGYVWGSKIFFGVSVFFSTLGIFRDLVSPSSSSSSTRSSIRRIKLRRARREHDLEESTPPELKRDKGFVYASVSKNGWTLEDAALELRGDKDVVLAAVRQNGLALSFASDDLKKDKEVVVAAVQQDGRALRFALDFKADFNVVLEAVRQNGIALHHASPDLRKDRKLALAAARSRAIPRDLPT